MINRYKAPKSVQKCVRMTQSAFEFVDSQEGKGFNEKFDNLIYRYENEVEKLERELTRLKEDIQQHRDYLRKISLLEEHSNRILNYMNYVECIIKDDIPELL